MNKVKNPKQLYAISLVKVRKIVSFGQHLEKIGILLVRHRRKLRLFLRNFWRRRLKFEGFMRAPEARAKILEYFAGEQYFYASGRKGCSKCGPFCSAGGGVLEHPQHPPSLRAWARTTSSDDSAAW